MTDYHHMTRDELVEEIHRLKFGAETTQSSWPQATQDEDKSQSEDMLWAILSSLYETIIIMFTKDGNQKFVWGDPDLFERYGFTYENLLETPLKDFLISLTKDTIIDKIRKVYTTAESLRDEYFLKSPRGVFWQDITLSPVKTVSGEVSDVVGFIRDITERKMVEEDLNKYRIHLVEMVEERTLDLKEKENELTALLNSMSDVAWFKDSSYRFILVNSTFASLIGCDQDSIKGKTDHDIFKVEEAALYRASDTRVMEENRSLRVEEPMTVHGGNTIIVESIKTPIHSPKGTIIGIVGVGRDITDRKKAEKELLQKEKLKGVIEMAGAACHEMNQPLQTIMGYIDLLFMDEVDESLQEPLKIIREQASRMAEITKN